MNIQVFILLTTLHLSCTLKVKPKNASLKPSDDVIKKIQLEKHEVTLAEKTKNKSEVTPVKITNVIDRKIVPVPPKKVELPPKMITPFQIQEWAQSINERLTEHEEKVVRRDVLKLNFTDIKLEVRNGTAIVNKMAADLEAVLLRRARAAEEVMRKAEELAKAEPVPDHNRYTFDRSEHLNEMKERTAGVDDIEENEMKPYYCRGTRKLKLRNSTHFDALVSLDATSVSVIDEVYDCDPIVMENLYWSEGLLSTFQKNYAQDATLNFQYFCSAQGFLRHYPAALWESLYQLKFEGLEEEDGADKIFDCRLRPWYVSAGGAPRDIVILLDASGSMTNSSNLVVAERYTLALLSALTDDDRVNVLRYSVDVKSPIDCFNDKLVPANHVNAAAMMAAMEFYPLWNETKMEKVLTKAVELLKQERNNMDRPPACQQAIVLLSDSLYGNFTEKMRELDPEGHIRLFVLWLHDLNGLRDLTRLYGEWLSCDRDGYFAEFITDSDVTEKVFKVLQVMERPLVAQRKDRLTVFSDAYAHVEDPRRADEYWRVKENKEQFNRYMDLRKNKKRLLSGSQLYKDWMYQINYNEKGQYYEGEDLNYRLQISVSVPVFEHRTSENITIRLDEEKQRNATRTYPVNRLLGVAGVDIPIDHLKLLLPYHLVSAGGYLILVDHRGNIVLHDNLKPSFDGDILKPGYRTVDFIDLEQPAHSHKPRYYPKDWLKFRKTLIIDKDRGNMTMYGKNIFEYGMRAILERRQYFWKRVLDHYTAVVVLPLYNRVHAVPDGRFTKKLAEAAWNSMSNTEFAVHPDWLYCRHVEKHFESREAEVRHFIKRRSDEANFPMQKLHHHFSPIEPSLFEKPYQCNEDLMARLCKEVIATDRWAREHEGEDVRDCSNCEMGSTTAFFATESGLTRWQQYHATSGHADPPSGSWWARSSDEPWYLRAAAKPGQLIVHAPVAPIAKMRISKTRPPAPTIRSEWFTAARTLSSPDNAMYGVAGYHFYPQHLQDLLEAITNHACAESNPEDCEARCDGKDWSCVLIDEYGWIVSSTDGRELTGEPEEPLREHFSRAYPAAMEALLSAEVFDINWVHDYQGVCFEDVDKENAAVTIVPTIMMSLWRSVNLILRVTQEMVILLTILSSSVLVSAETAADKAKRRRHLITTTQREKFDYLFDNRVLVNRTTIAACDRTRALYFFQDNRETAEVLKRPAKPCSWPLVGSKVPGTNLLLIAVYKHCKPKRPLNDPLENKMFVESEPDKPGKRRQPNASKLACWRNREPLPARPPHTHCYPHNYTEEAGYRQCGSWIPDVPDQATNIYVPRALSSIFILIFLLQYFNGNLF